MSWKIYCVGNGNGRTNAEITAHRLSVVQHSLTAMPHDALRMRWNFSFNANTIYCSQSFDGEIIERKNRINAQRKSPTLFAAFSHTHACARCAYCRRASNTTIYWSNNLKINDKKNSKHAALNSEWDGLSNNNCWSVVKIWSKLMRLSVLLKTI